MSHQYNDAIDALFDKLEAKAHRSRRLSNVSIEKAENVMQGVVAAMALIGLSGMVGASRSDYGLLLGSAGVTMGAVAGAIISSNEVGLRRFTNACLGLVGRALPLLPGQLEELGRWSSAHPRLAEILGKWSAANPDYCLNEADYRTAHKTMKRVQTIEQTELLRSQQKEALADTGFIEASSRARLTTVAAQAGTAPSPSVAPKRSM